MYNCMYTVHVNGHMHKYLLLLPSTKKAGFCSSILCRIEDATCVTQRQISTEEEAYKRVHSQDHICTYHIVYMYIIYIHVDADTMYMYMYMYIHVDAYTMYIYMYMYLSSGELQEAESS